MKTRVPMLHLVATLPMMIGHATAIADPAGTNTRLDDDVKLVRLAPSTDAPVLAKASAVSTSRMDDRSGNSSLTARWDVSGHRSMTAMMGSTRADIVPNVQSTTPWTALGPYGGGVADVAYSPIDSQIVLAGTRAPSGGGGRLYRSNDGGTTWSRVTGIPERAINDIEFNATGKVWIGTNDGILDSIDGGLTWTPRNLGIGVNSIVLDIALDPSNPLILWAGVDQTLGGTQPPNVLVSVDGGVSWVNRTPPLAAPMSARAISVDPSNSGNVVAAFGGPSGGGQVWITNNGGTSWVNRSAGLPSNPMFAVVHLGSRILVGGGQRFYQQDVGLYSTSDQGLTWTPLHNASWPSLTVQDVLVDPGEPATIWAVTDYGGVHRSSDGGTTWQIGVGGTAQISGRSLRRRPGASSTLILGVDGAGVLRSTDSGVTFAPSNFGMLELPVTSVAADPLDSQRLAASFSNTNSGGVYTSINGGTSWSLESLPKTRYELVKYAADGTLFAISNGPSTVAPEGVYVRRTTGTWVSLGPDVGPLYESDLRTLHVDAGPNGLIVAGGTDFGAAGYEGAIWRLLKGSNWQRVYESTDARNVEDLEVVPVNGGRVFVATWTFYDPSDGSGVLRSIDEGMQWLPASSGLPTGTYAAFNGRLCWLPGNPSLLVQSINSYNSGAHRTRIFTSANAASNWIATGYEDSGYSASDIACDPTGGSSVYLSRGIGAMPAVIRSLDGATTFEPFAAGLEPVTDSYDLELSTDVASPKLAFLASANGVYANNLTPLFADGFEN